MENLQLQDRRSACLLTFLLGTLLMAVLVITGCQKKEDQTSGQNADMTTSISVEQLKAAADENKDMYVLDVRTEPEFEEERLPFADERISYDSLAMHLNELPKDKDTLIYVFCRSGRRSGIATKFLRSMGYTNVHNVNGGIKAWKAAEYPTVSGPPAP